MGMNSGPGEVKKYNKILMEQTDGARIVIFYLDGKPTTN